MHNTRMVRKFGSMEAFEEVKKRHGLIPRGKEVGLDETCNFHQPQLDKRIQSSTMNSHRLVLYVSQMHGLDKCEELYDELNKRHFTQAGILNDRNLLIDALSVLQLSQEETTAAVTFLDSDRGINKVLEMTSRVDSLGIHSIPTLIVDGQYMISGAERSDGIYDLLVKAVEKGISGSRIFGDITVV